jgi:hypothetical protein
MTAAGPVPKRVPKRKPKMASNFKNRIAKLERVRGPKRSYVVHVSNPKSSGRLTSRCCVRFSFSPLCILVHHI